MALGGRWVDAGWALGERGREPLPLPAGLGRGALPPCTPCTCVQLQLPSNSTTSAAARGVQVGWARPVQPAGWLECELSQTQILQEAVAGPQRRAARAAAYNTKHTSPNRPLPACCPAPCRRRWPEGQRTAARGWMWSWRPRGSSGTTRRRWSDTCSKKTRMRRRRRRRGALARRRWVGGWVGLGCLELGILGRWSDMCTKEMEMKMGMGALARGRWVGGC